MQPAIISMLDAAGIDNYDFRNPPNGKGFGWSELMPSFDINNQQADVEEYLEALNNPRAIEAFHSDFDAMTKADAFILVLPCGRSAHLEMGWAAGAGKRTAVLLDPDEEFQHVVPELMYKMCDLVTDNMLALLAWLGV
jgi:hypothetical protein